ncbi:MAG: tetratricopeptide repeat protein, partial [Thermoanaerobaculia bacterium]
MKTTTALWLAALLPALPVSAAEKEKPKIRTKRELQVKAAKAERTKLEVKKETGPAKPALRADAFLRGAELKVSKLRDQQIKVLEKLIEATTAKDPEAPDLYFRKAELLGEKSTYYEFQARGLDQKIFEAKGSEKQRLEKQQKDYEKESQKWIYEAVKTYLLVAQSDNPVFRKYDRMDHVLFYLAFLLTQAKKQEQARVFFLRLIKDYPTSKFIPDAYLAFAEYYFYEGDMEAALKFYEKVTQYPESKVYGFAIYKTGWCWINLQDFEKALNQFVRVIKLTQAGKGAEKLGITALQKEAKRDAVRAYSEIGSPEQAWPFFQKIGGDFAPKMLELLAESYYGKGKFLDSIKVYRQLMSLNPESPTLCAWQNEVVKATLAARSKADQVKEVQRLAAIYEGVKAKPPEKKEVVEECRQATGGILRELATIWHKEAQKTQNNETYELAQYLYREYLERFPSEKDSYTMRFYYAELMFKLGEVYGKVEYWEKAAAEYTTLVQSNPQGEHAKEAAYAAVIAWKNALNIDDTSAQKLTKPDPTKPVEIPEKLQRMLAAFDTYIKYVPDAPELVQIKYNRARIYYEHNRFAEAAPTFDDIATNHSKHELAVYAANLHLDCLNVLERFAELDKAVDRYLQSKDLTADPSMNEQLVKLKQGSQWKYAEQLGKERKHKEAALLYVEIANAYPTWDRYPQVLYNAAVQFEAAYLIGQAIKMREHLITWDEERKKENPKAKAEPLAQKAVYEIGANYHALAWYSKAADHYERFATAFPGEKDAPKALYAATLFRMGLGEDKKAIDNSELFAKNYGRKRSKEAAAVFFEMYKIFEAKKQWGALIKHLEEYLKQWGSQGGVDRQIVAHQKLGELTWKLSCDQPGVNGACIEVVRVKARAVKEVKIKGKKKRRRGVAVNLKQCGPDTKMRITVFTRKKGWVKRAQNHFSTALSLYGKGKALTKVGGNDEEEKTRRTSEMMYSVAASRFYQAEVDFERFLRLEFPTDLDFSARDEKKKKESEKRFTKWLENKTAKLGSTQGIYQEVITHKVAHWAIAAAARIGQLFQTFSDQLNTAP